MTRCFGGRSLLRHVSGKHASLAEIVQELEDQIKLFDERVSKLIEAAAARESVANAEPANRVVGPGPLPPSPVEPAVVAEPSPATDIAQLLNQLAVVLEVEERRYARRLCSKPPRPCVATAITRTRTRRYEDTCMDPSGAERGRFPIGLFLEVLDGHNRPSAGRGDQLADLVCCPRTC